MNLAIDNISVKLGRNAVLSGLSIQFPPGITAVIGPNGAGKSTVLNTLAGLCKQSDGQIVLDGVAVPPGRPDIAVRRGMSLVPEGRRVFSDLTVDENLLVGAVKNRPRATLADVTTMYERFPELQRMKGTKAGSLSGGEQQMVAIARGLMSTPKFLLLDEPSLGLAPKRVSEIFTGIKALTTAGAAVVLVEQNVRAATRIADQVVQMNRGRVVRTGPASQFANMTSLEDFTE